MDTTVNNNIIQPRYYQCPNDSIDSKQAMEPLAIANGPGPLVGFNKISQSSNGVVTISSDKTKGINSKFIKYLSKGNNWGDINNAHITSSGLLSVDPDVLTFDNIAYRGPYTSGNPNFRLLVLISTLNRIDETAELVVPSSNANFKLYDIDNNLMGNDIFDELISLGYFRNFIGKFRDAFAEIPFNEVTDTVIGIYQLGYNSTRYSTNQALYQKYGVINDDNEVSVVLNPYKGVWPSVVPYTLEESRSIATITTLTDTITELERTVNQHVEDIRDLETELANLEKVVKAGTVIATATIEIAPDSGLPKFTTWTHPLVYNGTYSDVIVQQSSTNSTIDLTSGSQGFHIFGFGAAEDHYRTHFSYQTVKLGSTINVNSNIYQYLDVDILHIESLSNSSFGVVISIITEQDMIF